MIAAVATYWREAVIAALLVCVVGQQTRVANERTAHAQTRAEHAETLRELAERARQDAAASAQETARRTAANAAVDQKYVKELNDAREKNQKLADAVRAGRQRVLVSATCPPGGVADVPQAPASSSVVDAASPRLTEHAERRYFNLRTDIDTARNQIAGLQAYITNVCQPTSGP